MAPESLTDLLDEQEADVIATEAEQLFARLDALGETARMDAINKIRAALHEHSPMRDQPVDCVLWVPAEQVEGNAYNPNVVAPPEMELLRTSISADGFTQPIVAWRTSEESIEVVDGFHRHLIGKKDPDLSARLRGRLPVVIINADRQGEDNRMAATIRHNHARGKSTVEGLTEMVLGLHRTGKDDAWIAREFGMDPDEVLRLRQVGGLAEMFADKEFSEAWEVDPFVIPDNWNPEVDDR